MFDRVKTSFVVSLLCSLTMLLADGQFEGRTVVEASALQPALSPQVVSRAPATPDSRGGFYGYGFNVGTLASGRTSVGHAGAFALGAATAFTAVPSADVAIVTLTNAAPIGVPDTLNAEFVDLVQFGEIREDTAGNIWLRAGVGGGNAFAKFDHVSFTV